MEEKLIYGKNIADKINERTHAFIENCSLKHQRIPKISVILVGNSSASLSYIAGLEKLCQKVGMHYEVIALPEMICEQELIDEIKKCNEDIQIDGILIQMPLPRHICQQNVILAMDPNKDVDGLHPFNVGKCNLNQKAFVPCTALSVMAFLEEKVELQGKNVVVLGRSSIIGKPVAQLCLAKNATVTICHSKTLNIESICRQADIVIAAIGKAKHINENWIKEGAIVIDVGVNRDECNKLCGDVDLARVIDKVAYISPVPKGVGVVTNAMLLQNTIMAYEMKGE